MNKQALLKEFEKQILSAQAMLKESAVAAHEAATHSESKAEDQYDTRGLEASYLAGAQSKRVAELDGLLAIFRNVDVKTFGPDSAIAATAVIELESDGKRSLCFLMPKGGGMVATIDGKSVHVITPQSPLGAALLGESVGGEVSVLIQGRMKQYEVVSVI